MYILHIAAYYMMYNIIFSYNIHHIVLYVNDYFEKDRKFSKNGSKRRKEQ